MQLSREDYKLHVYECVDIIMYGYMYFCLHLFGAYSLGIESFDCLFHLYRAQLDPRDHLDQPVREDRPDLMELLVLVDKMERMELLDVMVSLDNLDYL